MNFPRDYHWKRRANMSALNTFNKPNVANMPQVPSIVCPKGVIRIEQYEYEEENLLGAGYSSKVYLGHLINDVRQNFAIKVIDRRRISKEREHLTLLKQEMDIHQHLDHPNIIKCHQIIERPTHYYIILEYCPQGTLENFIKKQDKLS